MAPKPNPLKRKQPIPPLEIDSDFLDSEEAVEKKQRDAAEARLREREEAIQGLMDAMKNREESISKREESVSKREDLVGNREEAARDRERACQDRETACQEREDACVKREEYYRKLMDDDSTSEAQSDQAPDTVSVLDGQEVNVTRESLNFLEGAIHAAGQLQQTADTLQDQSQEEVRKIIKILAAAFKRSQEQNLHQDDGPDIRQRLFDLLDKSFNANYPCNDDSTWHKASKWRAFIPRQCQAEIFAGGLPGTAERTWYAWRKLVNHINHDRKDLTRGSSKGFVLKRDEVLEWIAKTEFRTGGAFRTRLEAFLDWDEPLADGGAPVCLSRIFLGEHGYSDECNCRFEHLQGTRTFCPTIARGPGNSVALGFRESSQYVVPPLTWEDLPE